MTIAMEEAERDPTLELVPTNLQVGVDAVADCLLYPPRGPAPEVFQLCKKSLLREEEWATKVPMSMLAFHYADAKRHRRQFEDVATQSITRVRLAEASSDRIGKPQQHIHQCLVEVGRIEFSWPKYPKEGIVWNAPILFGCAVASRNHLY